MAKILNLLEVDFNVVAVQTYHSYVFEESSGDEFAVEYTGSIIIESCFSLYHEQFIICKYGWKRYIFNGYNRYTNIINNDFEYTGDSVIVSTGYTSSVNDNSDISFRVQMIQSPTVYYSL